MENLVNVEKCKKVFKEIQEVIFKNELTTCEAMMIIDEFKTCLFMDRISQSATFLNTRAEVKDE